VNRGSAGYAERAGWAKPGKAPSEMYVKVKVYRIKYSTLLNSRVTVTYCHSIEIRSTVVRVGAQETRGGRIHRTTRRVTSYECCQCHEISLG
jgi:hypothetical protein